MTNTTLSEDEYAVLEALEKTGEARIFELSSSIRLAPSEVSAIVDGLATRGLIVSKNGGLRLSQTGYSTLITIRQSPRSTRSSYGVLPSRIPGDPTEIEVSIDKELDKLKP